MLRLLIILKVACQTDTGAPRAGVESNPLTLRVFEGYLITPNLYYRKRRATTIKSRWFMSSSFYEGGIHRVRVRINSINEPIMSGWSADSYKLSISYSREGMQFDSAEIGVTVSEGGNILVNSSEPGSFL